MTENFDATVRILDDEIVVKVAGDVDLTSVRCLAEPLSEAVRAAARHAKATALSVDLRQVGFIDSAGLSLLINARKQLAPRGRALQVFVTKDQQPDRVLRLGRFDMIMQLRYDPAE